MGLRGLVEQKMEPGRMNVELYGLEEQNGTP
jgi:hypothetical protein